MEMSQIQITRTMEMIQMANEDRTIELELILDSGEELELFLSEEETRDLDLEKSIVIINPVTERDYENLYNKPSINGIELVGDTNLEDLGIDNRRDYRDLSSKPSINGVVLYDDRSLEDLGIEGFEHSEITNMELEELLGGFQ